VDVEISKHMPSGTDISASLSTSRGWGDLYSDSHATGIDVSITQALLAGRDPRANLASLRQAKLDVETSLYELRGFAESLVAQVETTYWDYALAKRQIEIYTGSLKLAEQQLSETQERVNVGKLAETELAAARAQVALRKEDLINARSQLEKIRLQLLRLLSPPGKTLWDREIILKNEPAVPDVKLTGVEEHVKVALLMRSDLNQARLSLRRGELEVVKTKNGLLPRLDLFITLGKTGYAESFYGSVDGFNRGSYNYSAGVSFEFPLGNRAAKARHRQAVLSRQQARESIENLQQLVQVDVRSAYIEVNRAKEQVSATAATRKLQEETLRTETEKFRVGKSTTFLVAQAQRDLVASQVSEVQAIVTYLKALVELFRLEGSLLERRGIEAPHGDPAGLITTPGVLKAGGQEKR
jgi:outer membrane protein TolC